jgi:hypothetical protein
MKTKTLFVALTLLIGTSSAFAQFFAARVNMMVLPGQVSAEVYNPFYEPIVCNGLVYGQTALGPVFNAFFTEQIMAPGTFRYAYVMTGPLNPFVGGWSQIHCRFLRWY